MAIAYIGASAPTLGTISQTPNWPASYTPTAGHYAIVVAGNGPNSAATSHDFATPSGWALLARNDDIIGWDSAAGDQAVFARVLAGSDTLPTFTNPDGNYYICTYSMVFSGVDTTTPMDATPVTSSIAAGVSNAWQPTGITTATNGAFVVSLFFNPRWNHSPTASGYNADTLTNVVSALGTVSRGSQAASYIERATAGAQTMPTWASDTDGCAHIALALRPAAGASVTFIAQNRIDANTSGWTLAEPTGTAQGDTVLVFGMQVGATRTITPPAGYTLIVKNETGTMGYLASG